MACTGAWNSRGKKINIVERDGGLFLEMGPEAPVLVVKEAPGDKVDEWPRKWEASRQDGPEPRNTLYLIELPSAGSQKLLVRRPVGDQVVEFLKVGNGSFSGGGGMSDKEVRRSRSRSRSPHRSSLPDMGHDELVSHIKRGQRESPAFKERWWNYCNRFGKGFYDPARHELSSPLTSAGTL